MTAAAPLARDVALPVARLTDREIAEWIVNTCVTFGAGIHTAYKVAGLFIEGIARPDKEQA